MINNQGVKFNGKEYLFKDAVSKVITTPKNVYRNGVIREDISIETYKYDDIEVCCYSDGFVVIGHEIKNN